MANKTYKVITFGCQMNAHDSEKIAGILDMKGYTEVSDERSADIVIYNTCTVRENANMKLYGHIGQLKSAYMKNKNKIIGICGCMMQEPDEVEKICEKYPYVKMIFGTYNVSDFGDMLDEVISTKKRVVRIYNSHEEAVNSNAKKKLENVNNVSIQKNNNSSETEVSNVKDKRVYSFKCGVNIMYGCNNFCTYCIVPYVRGRERSRNVSEIINEIKCDVKDGVVEVMLLGQNVNSYKGINDLSDINSKETWSFPQLLNEVCKIDGLRRVRFMTSHPKDLSDELIEVIKNNPKVCRHIHLPVQSGSDKILLAMNRHYDRERYLDVIKKIRDNIEDVGITTDIIVGFPGETDDDFNDTLSLIKEVGYDAVFTFEYSKRTGTKAAEMEKQVPESAVKERFARLLKVVEESSHKNSEKYVGKVVEVLVEGEDKVSGKLTGRMSNNYLVHFDGDLSLIGKLKNVSLTKSCGFYFEGKIESVNLDYIRYKKEVDETLKGIDVVNDTNEIKVCDTPEILIKCGMKQYPILYRKGHLRDAIKEKNALLHYHGLSLEQIYNLPKNISEPAIILKNREDSKTDFPIVIINDFDNENFPIFIMFEMNTQGFYDFKFVNTNEIVSLYGRKNFNVYLKDVIDKNRLIFYDKEKVQNIDTHSGTQLFAMCKYFEPNIILQQLDGDVKAHE